MRETVIFLMGFIFSFFPITHTLSQSQKVEFRYENFRIIYPAEEENLSKIVIQNLETRVTQYESFFAMPLKGIVIIEIPGSPAEYQAGLQERLPIWSNGYFSSSRKAIILKKPEWYMNPEDFGVVFRHELVHAYFHSKFQVTPTPLWLNEGLAEYLAGKWIGIEEGMLLSNALFSKNLVTLTDLDSLNYFNSMRARLAYLESLTAVTFLENQLRQNGVSWQHFFDLILNHGFEESLKLTTSYDLIDFEIAWYRWLKETYRWFLIFNWENLIWLIIIIILLGSMYGIRYRNRKILEEWEGQENQEKDNLADSITLDSSEESERKLE